MFQILWLSPAAISVVLAFIFCLTLIEFYFFLMEAFLFKVAIPSLMHRESHKFDGDDSLVIYVLLEFVLAV